MLVEMVFYIDSIMKQIQIYMPLLNEGTNVARPVFVHDMGNGNYKIIGVDDGLTPEELGEEWLFPIGSLVICKVTYCKSGKVLIAERLSEKG